MKTCFLRGTIVLLANSLLAANPDAKPAPGNASGKWKSEFDTPVGHLKYVYDLKASGDQFTGTAIREREGAKTEIELKEVSVTGDQVSFIEPIKFHDQDVRIEYKGKLAGDEIKFTRKVGDYATAEIVAHRVKQEPASLDGKWNSVFDTQIGQQKYVFEFKTDGEKLSGKATGEMQFGKFETPITDGKFGPTGVSFVELLKLPDNEIKIEYTGKLVGDELKLTRRVGDFATEQIVAKRAPASGEKSQQP